jgi:hypothetical protein
MRRHFDLLAKEPFLNSAGQANADVTTIVNNTIRDSALAPSA